jgi:hypothetical protein
MSSERWWLSGLIVFHLAAITSAALPPPSELQATDSIEPRNAADVPSSHLAAALEQFAHATFKINRDLNRWSIPLRALTRPYINAGLRQRWNMFANPAQFDAYMRIDYLVGAAAARQPSEVFRELVFPVTPEDQPHLWRHSTDKAIYTAIENYQVTLQRVSDVREAPRAPGDFAPVARYFSGVFRNTLAPGRRLIRVEVRYGRAPIPPPGQAVDDDVLAARLRLLDNYRHMGTGQPVRAGAMSVPLETTQDADITWLLVYAGEA